MYEVVILKNTRIALGSYRSFAAAWATIPDNQKDTTTVERRRKAYCKGEHVPQLKGTHK